MTETVSDTTEAVPVTPAPVLRNPRPRPALRFEGEENWVVAARPLPGQTEADEPAEQAEGKRQRKGKDEAKEEKRKKSGKNRRRKAEKKRPKEASESPDTSAGAARDREARSITITLPEEFRKALDRAAGEHGLSAEGLAAFVLVEWLDR